MGWKGIAVGSLLGHYLFGPLGIFGSLLGAFVGHSIEKQILSGKGRRRAGDFSSMSGRERSMAFCASVAAMLAKMAKADGHVSSDEIKSVEEAFCRLGFTPAARAYAIDIFRKAKDDRHSIYEYAQNFADIVDSIDVRELLYEILWDLATTDGGVTVEERLILERIPRALGIRPEWYAYFAYGRGRAPGGDAAHEPRRDELAAAYSVLGASPSDSNDTLKRKYRELAKRNHPDALRAQGLPEGMIGKATERMSRINAAWETLKQKRGIS